MLETKFNGQDRVVQESQSSQPQQRSCVNRATSRFSSTSQSQVEYIHHVRLSPMNSIYKRLLHKSLHKSGQARLMKVYDPDRQDLHTSYDSAEWLWVDAVILFHWISAGAEGTFTQASTRQVYQFHITGNGCWLQGLTIKTSRWVASSLRCQCNLIVCSWSVKGFFLLMRCLLLQYLKQDTCFSIETCNQLLLPQQLWQAVSRKAFFYFFFMLASQVNIELIPRHSKNIYLASYWQLHFFECLWTASLNFPSNVVPFLNISSNCWITASLQIIINNN